MNKKLNDHLKLRSKKTNYINAYFSLYLLFLFSFFSMQNFNSEIQLVINGNGLQNILSSSFYTEPSDVIVNGISKKIFVAELVN